MKPLAYIRVQCITHFSVVRIIWDLAKRENWTQRVWGWAKHLNF